MAVAIEQLQLPSESDRFRQSIDEFMEQNRHVRPFLQRAQLALILVEQLRQEIGSDLSLDTIDWYAQREIWFKSFGALRGAGIKPEAHLSRSVAAAYKRLQEGIAQHHGAFGAGPEAQNELVGHFHQARLIVKDPQNVLLQDTRIDEHLLRSVIEGV